MMSGGSLNYAQDKIEEIKISLLECYVDYPELLPLIKHMERLGNVLGDIEWSLSCDKCMTPEETIKAIKSITKNQDVLEAMKHLESELEGKMQKIKLYLECRNE